MSWGSIKWPFVQHIEFYGNNAGRDSNGETFAQGNDKFSGFDFAVNPTQEIQFLAECSGEAGTGLSIMKCSTGGVPHAGSSRSKRWLL